MTYNYFDPLYDPKSYVLINDIYKVINRSPFDKYVKNRLTELYEYKLRDLPDHSKYFIPTYSELVNRSCRWAGSKEGHKFWEKQASLYADIPIKIGHKRLEDL